MTETTLILFCKRPAPGFGKQRLAAEIGSEAAFEVAQKLLACALEDLRDWAGPVVVSPSSRNEIEWASTLLERDYEVIPQSSGNLGERIESIDRVLRMQGRQRQIVIGSDAPELSLGLLSQANKLLDESDVVFSSAEDGGVSLMGTRCGWPPLEPMPWSTAVLGQALMVGCEQNHQIVSWAEACSDVDRLMDLERIRRVLPGDERKARQALLKVVERVINR